MEQTDARVQDGFARLPGQVRLYLVLISLLFSMALLAIFRVYRQGRPLKYAHQWTEPNDRFGDFWHYRALLMHLHRPEFFSAADRFAYPAPCAILYKLLYGFGPHPHLTFNVMLWLVEGMSASALAILLIRRSIRPVVAIGSTTLIALTSFSWFLLYDRGNVELFVYAAVALGLWAWASRRYKWAAVAWGTAASLKMYPLLLLVLFATRQRRKAFLVGVLTFLLILLFSFWYVGPTVAMAAKGTLAGITGFRDNYAAYAKRDELWLDHSLLGATKEVLSFPPLRLGQDWERMSHVYEGLLVLGLPAVFVLVFRKLPEKNRLCLLLVAMMLLPPVSYEYTLIYSYLVLGIVLDVTLLQEGAVPRRVLTALYICFALLSGSESWLRPAGLEFNPLLKCGALVTISILLLRFPLRMGKLADSPNPETVG